MQVPLLEQLIVQDFGLTNPTPLQRAICRIADGQKLGNVYNHPDVVAAIGPLPPRCIPKAILLLCGIRTGKSLIAAAAAVRCALTCDTRGLLAGETPRVSVLSTRKDLAKAIMGHLLGAFRTSGRLASLMTREPLAESLFIRHPTGRPIEINVVAGARAGETLVSRWFAGVIFDEAPRMIGAEDGVVNLDDSRQAVAGRLLPGACTSEWIIGSPWAPFGPVYQEVTDKWKKSDARMIIVRARADTMNPAWWTPDRIKKLEQTDPDAYKTDFLAEFSDPDSALIAGVHIDHATRHDRHQIRPEEGDRYEYAAEMDPATRGNAWTLIVTKREMEKTIVVLAREWRGTKAQPLSSKKVLQDIAGLLAPYRIAHSDDNRRRIGTDQFAVDIIRDTAKEFGLDVVEFPATRASNDDGYLELARRFELGQLEIPDEPNLISDLRRLRKKATAGGVHVDLPNTSDGRHCDFAPSLMRAAQRETYQPQPLDTTPQWKKEQDKSLRTAIDRYGRSPSVPWWKRNTY